MASNGETKKTSKCSCHFSYGTIRCYILATINNINRSNRTADLHFNVYMTDELDKTTSQGYKQGEMDAHVGGGYDGTFSLSVTAGTNSKTTSTNQKSKMLYLNWGYSKTVSYHRVDNFGSGTSSSIKVTGVKCDDDGNLSASITFNMSKRALARAPSTYQTIKLNLSSTVKFTDVADKKINWEAPSTSGFYYTAKSQIYDSTTQAKPEESIKVTCGGMSGGTGEGAYRAYKVTMTTTRNNKTYVIRDESTSTVDTNLVPDRTYLACRPRR